MKAVLYSTVISFLLMLPSWANSQVIDEQSRQATKAQLTYLQEKIHQISKTIANRQKKYNQAINQLEKNEKSISDVSKQLRFTKKSLRENRDELIKMRANKKMLTLKKERHTVILKKQIKNAYMHGSQAYLKLLLNQKSPAQLGRNVVYYRFLNDARIESINTLKKTVAELDTIKLAIENKVIELAELKRKQENRRKSLNRQVKKREKLVAELRKKLRKEGKELSSLKANEKEVIAILDAINEVVHVAHFDLDGLSGLEGKLAWPLNGKLKNKFGSNRDDGKLKWKGVLIDAPEGKDVRAIHHGRVMYADWLRGFGLLTVVDHGSGYVSLYGHNQSLFKEAGDWVQAGELIATVGQSGGNEQAGLYFEIRKGAKPLNPTKWCSNG